MIDHSPELRTDLIFHRELGTVTDRGDYLVLETPSEPFYYYGNLLHLARPPAPGEVAAWRERFALLP